jgi:DNA-binding LacI/PurR family transcriptional regulator
MERLASLPELPTAILAANDLVAIGAAHVLHKLGYKVPADVSVVGYDNIRMAELFNPPLTTVAQPMYQLGETAMRALLRRWAKPTLNGAHKKFHPELVVRESTGTPRRDKQTPKTNRRTPYA